MYSFQFEKLSCGKKRRIESGTVLVRCKGALEVATVQVHLDVLLDASGLYRALVEECGAVPVFDISQASLEPWQLDYFLCMAYSKKWESSAFTEEHVRAIEYFVPDDYVYQNADKTFVVPGASRCLKLLVSVDPLRSKLPTIHTACMKAMCNDRAVFRDKNMDELSKDTIIAILRISERRSRYDSPELSISAASSL